MKIAKMATTGIIVLGSLTFPSSSLAEVGNEATNKVEMVQRVKAETVKTEVVTQTDLLQLQDYLKQQEKLYTDEDKLKEQANTVENKELENKLADLHNQQEKLQKEIQTFKESIHYPKETVEVDKKEENKVETEQDVEKEYLKKREDNKKEVKLVQDKLQELKVKQEAELKAKQETELKAKQEAEMKAKEEADLKAKQEVEEKAKKDAELKAKQESELKAKQESELKTKEESELKVKEEEAKAKEELDLKVKQEAELKAKEETDLKAKQEAELKATKEEVKPSQANGKKLYMSKKFYFYNDASLSSGISSECDPQYVNVIEERADGWVKIQTWLGQKWVLPNGKKLYMSKKFYFYNDASLSSGISSECDPQYVNVIEERADGWVKIQTWLGQKWVLPNGKKLYMSKKFYFYNDASLSSGISSECDPQYVNVIEERVDGWVKIQTWLGQKWVLPNGKKLYMSKKFYFYNDASLSSGISNECDPQYVNVIEERVDGWVKIQTWLGQKWVNTKVEETESVNLSRVFFAYDSPNFSSNVAGKFAPQTVTVVGRQAGGWIQIRTNLGLKWVNQSYLTNDSVMLDVPSYYQYPQLYNGCEVVSLQMLVEYHTGRSFNMVNFAHQMPKDTTPMVKQGGRYKTWGDPDVGFVGDVTGNRPGFSINPAPLKHLLDQYAQGTNLTGHSFSVLENYVRNGKPVVAWVTEGLTTPNSPVTWQTPQGKTIYARFNTHAVTITGVDGNNVYYNDPVTGKKNARAEKSWFENIYNQMGKKALSID
ncbi:C39 family peptidase [Bacillus cereus]|uniref:N-acetylmuramoyl-L-alanine amidase n=1 Tax=Bacillus cereus TaxID=1396 RepID=A0A1S9UIP1_BACCE|nr:C39 family peptidase [Bacillus cereus]OOR22099.1 N-acetylmuramoyl-L-alanine amidase [Bacillus cereus]